MIQFTIDDMRAAGKNGYVAKLNGKDRQFLKAVSTTGYSTSRNQVTYEISESDHGIYEISDANLGGRRKLYYLAIAPHGSEWCDSVADAEKFINPPAPVEPSYPGLKAEAATPPALADVRVAIAKQGEDRWLKVEVRSDAGFKYFLPDLKQRVPGREWLAGAKYWKVPLQSALQLREIIEEYTIRTNGIRTPQEFEITNGAKQAMVMD